MAILRSIQLRVALDYAEQLLEVHTFRDVETLLLPGLARLLSSDMAVYHHVDLGKLEEIDVFWPIELFLVNIDSYSTVMEQHPFVKRFTSALPAAPVTLLDFLSPRQWRSSAVYSVSHRQMGADHQMTDVLAARHPAVRAVSVARGNPAYSETERELMALVRPHVRSALRTAYLGSVGYQAYRSVPVVGRAVLGRPDKVFTTAGTGSALLSAREYEVLELLAAGLTNGQIARRLRIAPATVAKHLEHAYEKMGVNNRVSAVQVLGGAC